MEPVERDRVCSSSSAHRRFQEGVPAARSAVGAADKGRAAADT